MLLACLNQVKSEFQKVIALSKGCVILCLFEGCECAIWRPYRQPDKLVGGLLGHDAVGCCFDVLPNPL